MIYGLLGVLAQIGLSILGLYKIKTAVTWVSFSMVAGLGCYGLSFALWVLLLRVYPVSVIFPFVLSSNLLVTEIFSVVVLREPWNYWQLGAIAFIVIGIALLSWGNSKIV